jgi:hypothetical protein
VVLMARSERAADGLEKLKSGELRRRAAEGDPDGEVVLAEMDLPQPMALAVRRRLGGSPVSRPTDFRAEATDRDEHDIERKIAEARQFLTTLTGHEPQYLASSQTFIVEANGSQLREIAHHPLFTAIWPNRKA